MAGDTFRGTTHVSQALSNVAFNFKSMKSIWSQVLKAVPVNKEADSYYIFDSRAFMRYYGKVRANKTKSHRVDTYHASVDTYKCEEHSYNDIVTDRDRNLADAIIKPDMRVTKSLMEIVDMDIEAAVATIVFATGNFSGMTATASATSSYWDSTDPDGTPLEDVDAAKRLVQKEIGVFPNTMIVGGEVHDQLKRHPDILEIYKYTGKGIMSNEQIRAAFDVENYVVGDKTYVNTLEGQTETTAFLWGKYCALLYVPPGAAIDEPAWGYVYLHKLFGTLTAKVKKWREEGVSGDIIEAGSSFDLKQTSKKAGYLYSEVIK